MLFIDKLVIKLCTYAWDNVTDWLKQMSVPYQTDSTSKRCRNMEIELIPLNFGDLPFFSKF